VRDWLTGKVAPFRAIESASLRTQLLVSHVGLIALIVLGFGIALYAITSRAIYRQAEADLFAVAHSMAEDLTSESRASVLSISDVYIHRFGPAQRDRAYLAVWDAEGKQQFASPKFPSQTHPANSVIPAHGPHPYISRSYGSNLEVIVQTPQNGRLLIGRPLAKEFDGLRHLLLNTVLTGGICLGLGALGAWWLAGQMAQPLTQMATSAENISGQNLNQRLDTGRASFEITRLATVYNAMLDRLQAAFIRQRRFTADASHELRTPVSVIIAQVDHTLARDRTEAEYRDALQTTYRAAQQMQKLTEELLLLARADAGQLALHQESVELSHVVQNAIAQIQPLALKKNIHFETHLLPVRVSGNTDQLRRVVLNLITNAVQYNFENGFVRVDLRIEHDAVYLLVHDNGQGIPVADQPFLFDRFYRVKQASSQIEDHGTGLGLSLVAEIIAAHNGTITVNSVLHEGTTMTVRLPVVQSHNQSI
jgi:heavy metal sensor kinase